MDYHLIQVFSSGIEALYYACINKDKNPIDIFNDFCDIWGCDHILESFLQGNFSNETPLEEVLKKKKVKEFKQLIEDADKQNKSRIILATSTSIGEGFDDSRLDTLFLTMPVSWKGRIIQYVGRLHREHIEKNKVVVYDYLDNMKVLDKMYNRRLKGYKVAGYEIIEED